MLLITRPLPKLQTSASAFEAAGINVIGVATSDIEPNPASANELTRHLISGKNTSIIIVTSVYAVPAGLSAIQEMLLHASKSVTLPLVIAVGDATADALKAASLPLTIVTPLRHTSEGILVMQQLNEANCQQVVIIKGQGGRDALAYALRKRGIPTTEFCVYKRVPLTSPVYTKTWKIGEVSGIIATSENMAKQLISNHNVQLLALPWLTVSERVATSLRNLGITRISVCDRATDQALIAWVKENWEC